MYLDDNAVVAIEDLLGDYACILGDELMHNNDAQEDIEYRHELSVELEAIRRIRDTIRYQRHKERRQQRR